jgi:hypothetical protein
VALNWRVCCICEFAKLESFAKDSTAQENQRLTVCESRLRNEERKVDGRSTPRKAGAEAQTLSPRYGRPRFRYGEAGERVLSDCDMRLLDCDRR